MDKEGSRKPVSAADVVLGIPKKELVEESMARWAKSLSDQPSIAQRFGISFEDRQRKLD